MRNGRKAKAVKEAMQKAVEKAGFLRHHQKGQVNHPGVPCQGAYGGETDLLSGPEHGRSLHGTKDQADMELLERTILCTVASDLFV